VGNESPRRKIRAQKGRGDRRSAHAAEYRGSRQSRRYWSQYLLRWLKVPEFQAAYRAARRAAFGQSIARLQQGTSAAATTLLKTMIDSNTPASVKVRAAEAIFNHAAKAIEIEDIDARVTELELAAEASKPGHSR
jgi:hypothetical protein